MIGLIKFALGDLLRRTGFWAFLGWLAFGVLLFLYLGHPRTVTVTKIEFKEKVDEKKKWKAKIIAGPTAVTTVAPDGTLTVTGPTTLEASGASEKHEDRETKTSTVTRPADREWGLAFGAALPVRDLINPQPWAAVSRRIIGGAWLDLWAMSDVALRSPMIGLAVRLEI